MANDNWFVTLESKLFTIIKTRLTRNIGSKYPSLFCTTSPVTDADPVFPTVYIHELPGMEMGQDIENTGINAVLETLQIEVTTNNTMKECADVASAVILQLKALHFNIIALPVYSYEGNVIRGIIRARRMIGSDDSLT